MLANGYQSRLKSAGSVPSVWGYRLYRHMFPEADESASFLKKEKSLLWQQAEETADKEMFYEYMYNYPEDKKSLEAEKAYYRLLRFEELGERWPKATIASRRELPTGEVELVVDVRDYQTIWSVD